MNELAQCRCIDAMLSVIVRHGETDWPGWSVASGKNREISQVGVCSSNLYQRHGLASRTRSRARGSVGSYSFSHRRESFAFSGLIGETLKCRAPANSGQAIDLDTRHQYADSVRRYDEALAIFARARDEVAVNDPVAAVAIAQKMEEYAARAKTLRDALAQNPFHSPQPQPSIGLSMAAPIPVDGAPPSANPAPAVDLRGYTEMPVAANRIQPVPAPLEYPAYLQPSSQPANVPLPAHAPPPQVAPDNKITKTKEQEFVGHKNKIKFTVTLPRYAERLCVSYILPPMRTCLRL